MVNKSPSHYTRGTIEVWDFIRDQQLNYHLGNAIKYICRAGYKSPSTKVEDLKKAIHYLENELQHTTYNKKFILVSSHHSLKFINLQKRVNPTKKFA